MSSVYKKESDIVGFLQSAKRGVNDPVYIKAVSELDHQALKDAVAQRLEEEQKVEKPIDELVEYIMQCFSQAKEFKSTTGETARQSTSVRLRQGCYTSEELELLGGPNTAVWYPLTDRLCRLLSAFLRNVMARDDNNPNWEITATPIPELPELEAEKAYRKVIENAMLQVQLGFEVTEDDIFEELDSVSENLLQELKDSADKNATKVTRYILDMLVDAGWRSVFDQLLDDATTYGTAILKGPFLTAGPMQTYDNTSTIKTKTRKRLGVKMVCPEDIYPSADSTDTQNGTFIIELSKMSRRELIEAKKLPGFIADNITLAMTCLESGDRDWLSGITDATSQRDDKSHTVWSDDQQTPIVEYRGALPGRLLKRMDIETVYGRELDMEDYYEAEVYVLNGVVIRAILNFDPLFKRNYHRMCLFPMTGSFWGRGVPLSIESFQRVINAAYRALVRNIGYASAPIFEFDHALQDNEVGKAPTNIAPGTMIDKNSFQSPNSGRALDVVQIQSRGAEFQQIIASLVTQAELVVGLPKFLQGDPSGAGGAGSTYGGLATLQSNANVNLKSMVVSIDTDIIKPFIEQIYSIVISVSDEFGADAQVNVLGATTLLAKELNKDKLLSTIGALTPFVEAGYIKPEGVSELLREVVREIGINPDDAVVDLNGKEALAAEMQAALQNAGGVSGGISNAAQSPTFQPGGGTAGQPAPLLN